MNLHFNEISHTERAAEHFWAAISAVPISGATHQLTRQQGHVLYDGQADPPLGVLGELHDGWQERLGELTDADHLVDTVQVGDDVETHLGTLVTHSS